MAEKAEEIVAGLRFLAERADTVGASDLGDLIRDAINSYAGNTPSVRPSTVTAAEDTDVTVVIVDNDETPIEALEDEDDEFDAPELDPLDQLAREVEAAVLAEALPHTLTLIITPEDANVVLDAEQVADAAELVRPAIVAQLRSEFTAGEPAVVDGVWNVQLEADDLQARMALTGLGINQDGFNGVVYVADVPVLVRSLVGQPDDLEAAAEFGIVEPDLEAPTAGHQINVGVDRAEQFLGHRPQAATIEVTYRRTDGNELTEAMTHTIVNHPVSQHPTMGLPRFGELTLMNVIDGSDQSSKTAVFMVGETGEVDAASMSSVVSMLGGVATQYAGSYPFDGMGVVSCSSRVQLVGGNGE
jgi:uncharacterized cupredoxin-like copper-binding protein